MAIVALRYTKQKSGENEMVYSTHLNNAFHHFVNVYSTQEWGTTFVDVFGPSIRALIARNHD